MHRLTLAKSNDGVVTCFPPVAYRASVQVHERFHFGRDRALKKLNVEYLIPNKTAVRLLARVKVQCESCRLKTTMPKRFPNTPDMSMTFAERILVDLKPLGKMGYMIVAVCHWSKYYWLGYLHDKRAKGVAEFLSNAVVKEIEEVRSRRSATREEAKLYRNGREIFPVPDDHAMVTETDDTTVNISLSEKHGVPSYLEVNYI